MHSMLVVPLLLTPKLVSARVKSADVWLSGCPLVVLSVSASV